ncbi:PspC domain-containing protein [Mucilaginibacter robiniae]|uniref:PspC domain-containing protein n=1 Tax=Mucilaginibacter robiniae TaxID=2728022 RepID=A0A7L5E6T3_9SPHI|nr:PspC domain-containing protein [Mucilaginibacter robiniae]QJD97474.1 PspC domain-containing protein [Mucilaginibacter robiniae]
MNRKLYRDEQHKVIGGVCAGLAEYFDVDIAIVRAIFLLALILKGTGVLFYIVLLIVLPKKPYSFINPGVDYAVPPQPDASFEPFTKVKPVRNKSNAGLIGGMVLIMLGLFLLLDQFDFIPDLDFEHLWPIIPIVVGLVFIFTSRKNKPVDHTSNPNPPIV